MLDRRGVRRLIVLKGVDDIGSASAADVDSVAREIIAGMFDAVIDLDAAHLDPADPTRLLPEADIGDHLHPK